MLLIAYAALGIATAIYAWRGIVEEMGPIKDFLDFGSALYTVVIVGMFWPVFGLFYGLWTLYKKSQSRTSGSKFKCEICGGTSGSSMGVWDYCQSGHTYVAKRSEV